MLLPDKNQRLRFLESNLESLIYDARSWMSRPSSLMHLNRGVAARHHLLRHCREYLERTCFTETKDALSPDESTEAALHLNGYYLNLRGVLDNLAWMLNYELSIFPGTTDEAGDRTKVYLFGSRFLKSMAQRSERHAKHLLAMKGWGVELAALRDPAAHRIPLYVPPSTITSQNQMDEFHRLDQLSGAPEEELAGQSRIEIVRQAYQVASFLPIFCVTSDSGIRPYGIRNQLIYDHRRYLHLTRKLLEAFK